MEPLRGLKILDFSALLPGPYATVMLADLGADVLGITGKGRHDMASAISPDLPGADMSAVALWLGRNKRDMYLNLKHPGAFGVVSRLIADYDVILEQFRPGVMDRLGFGYDALKKINPALIYCSLTGYGQTGGLRDRAGHDINFMARSGVMSYSGRQECGPALTSMQVSDLAAGSMNAVTGILAAYVHRLRTGEGQYIDVSMLDGMLSFNAMYGAAFLGGGSEPLRDSELLNGGSLYDFYETKDGRYLSVGCLEPKFFAVFCSGIGLPDLIKGSPRPTDLEQTKEKVRSRILEKTLEEWTAVFDGLDACVEPVMTLDEAFTCDEHIRERQMVTKVPVPAVKGMTVKQIAYPVKLSGSPASYRHAAYPPGYHTREVMTGLGYDEETYLSFERDGLFG